MTLVTYVPSDTYPTIQGATVIYGAGLTFDIKAALVAGGGTSFTIDDTAPNGALIIAALDGSIAVKRSGTVTPPRYPLPVPNTSYITDWAANTQYLANQVIRAPDGSLERVKTNFNEDSTYSASDFTPIGAVAGSTDVLTTSPQAGDLLIYLPDGKLHNVPRPEMFVEDYRPIGGTDDQMYAALVAATGVLGGRWIHQRGRVYQPTVNPGIPSNVIFDLNGATYKWNGGTNTQFLTNSDIVGGNVNIIVANGVFDGTNRASDTTAGSPTFTSVVGLHFRRIIFQNMPVQAIVLVGCDDYSFDEACEWNNIGTAQKMNAAVAVGCGIDVLDSSNGRIKGRFRDIWQIPVFISTLNGVCANTDIDVDIDRCWDNGVRLQPNNVGFWFSVYNTRIRVRARRVRIDSVRLNGLNNTVEFADITGIFDTGTFVNGSNVVTVTNAAQWSVNDPVNASGFLPALGADNRPLRVQSINTGTNQLTLTGTAVATGVFPLTAGQAGIKTDGGTRLTVRQADIENVATGIYWRLQRSQYLSNLSYDALTTQTRIGKVRIRNTNSPFVLARVDGTEDVSDFKIDGVDIDGSTCSGTALALEGIRGVSVEHFDIHDAAAAGMSFTNCVDVKIDHGRCWNNQRLTTGYGGAFFSNCLGITVGSGYSGYDNRVAGSKTQEYAVKCSNGCSKIRCDMPISGLNAGAATVTALAAAGVTAVADYTNKTGQFNFSGDCTEIVRLDHNTGGILSTPAQTTLDLSGALKTRLGATFVGALSNSGVAGGFVSGDSVNSWNLLTNGQFLGLALPTKAGRFTDADLPNSGLRAVDGDVGINTTAKRLNFRSGAAWVERANERKAGFTGITAPTLEMPCSLTSVTVPGDTMYLCRFVPDIDMTITLLAFIVSNNSSTDQAFTVGILNSTQATILASSASTTGKLNTGGLSRVTGALLSSSLTVVAGTVYYGAVYFGTPPTSGTSAGIQCTQFNTSANAGLGWSALDTTSVTIPNMIQGSKTAAGGFIAAPGPSVTNSAPVLYVRES